MSNHDRTGVDGAARPKTSGFTAVGIFLFFGAVMASFAATTLLWRGTALDRLWVLNPTAYKQLAPLGGIVGTLFVLLGLALTAAGIGWFRRRLWGWRLAFAIIATQVLGDIVNCLRGDSLRGGIGIPTERNPNSKRPSLTMAFIPLFVLIGLFWTRTQKPNSS